MVSLIICNPGVIHAQYGRDRSFRHTGPPALLLPSAISKYKRKIIAKVLVASSALPRPAGKVVAGTLPSGTEIAEVVADLVQLVGGIAWGKPDPDDDHVIGRVILESPCPFRLPPGSGES